MEVAMGSLAPWIAAIGGLAALFGVLKILQAMGQWFFRRWRRRRLRVDSDEGWDTPYDARMRFAESGLCEALAAAELELAHTQVASEEARNALGRINAQMPREEASGLSDAYQACDTRYGAALAR